MYLKRSFFALLLPGIFAATACGGGSAGDDKCAGEQTRCVDDAFQVCNADGVFETQEACSTSCSPNLGCTECEANASTCMGDVSVICKPDGSGFIEEVCDPIQDLSCNEDTGLCEGPCSMQEIGQSYVGCDYYPTVTGNLVRSEFEFAVAVSNTSAEPADITISDGPLADPIEFTVAPGEVQVQRLPWNFDLKMCATAICNEFDKAGALSENGAFHLRSNHPVTVFQFNPLDYQIGPTLSQTNDASILLPTTSWRSDYVAASWKTLEGGTVGGVILPSFVAITAFQDGTDVTLTTTANTPAAGGAPAFTTGEPQTVMLNRGDVLEISAFSLTTPNDLTGSLVSSTKPVQVIGGNACALVPDDQLSGRCDHVEESIFPVDTLDKNYLVTTPATPTNPDGTETVVRIIATEDDTALSYDPPLAGAPTSIARAGEFVELTQETETFAVSADKRIMVVQFMEGADVIAGNDGDPAMTLVVGTTQFRRDYLFHAPTNYDVNFANIIAPIGQTVTLDETDITDFTPIGDSGFGVARVQLDDSGNGNHTARSAQPFGISVYGYGVNTSYWYPGGLDLDFVPVE